MHIHLIDRKKSESDPIHAKFLQVKKLACSSMMMAVCLLGVLVTVNGAEKKHQKGQYKKQNRDRVTSIAQGNPEGALQYAHNYLSKYPSDCEALYIQSLAYTQKNELNKALQSVKRALNEGMPFGRFIAGPRNLFEPLYRTEGFQKLAEQQDVRLVHGPVLGDVTATSARFWMRTASEDNVKVVVSPAPNMKDSISSGTASTKKEDDFTCVVQVNNLSPDTKYFYRIEVNGEPVKIDLKTHFHTYPLAEKGARFRVAFGGGAGYTPWYEHMWKTILKESPIAFLALGDNVYIDTPEVRETQRYCYYRRQSVQHYRNFTAATPIYAIWDDHDFGTNDSSGSLSLDKPPWKMDVLEVFKQNFVNPYYGTADNPGCYFDFSIGDVDFFLLECRFYRDQKHNTMLGPAQKMWLKNKLRNSTATFKVICSSVPWASGVKPGSKDTWDGFPREREEIFAFLEDSPIDGVVLVSADRHRSDARRIPRENGPDLYDFMSSKLTNIHTHGLVKDVKGSEFLFGYNEKCSFGLLEFNTKKTIPEVTYKIVNIDGQVVESCTLTKSANGSVRLEMP